MYDDRGPRNQISFLAEWLVRLPFNQKGPGLNSRHGQIEDASQFSYLSMQTMGLEPAREPRAGAGNRALRAELRPPL